MMLFDVDTWPNYLRWLLFFPISILVFLIIYIFNVLVDGPSFLTMVFIGAIGRPLTLYIGIRIVPKAKKIVAYGYLSFYIFDVIASISGYFISYNGISPDAPTWYNIGGTIGILIGTIITFIIIIASDFEKDFK